MQICSKEQFLEIMNERHACKLFNSQKKISEDNINYILEIGRLSASSFGMEHWQFITISDNEIKKEIQKASWNQPQITSSTLLIVILARKNLRSNSNYVIERFKSKGLKDNLLEAYLNKYSTFIDSRTDFEILEWSKRQTYIAMANMTNGASAIGIDSCPIEGFESEKVESILNIDKDNFAVSIILPFGYRLNSPKIKNRRSFDEVVTKL